LGKVLLSFLDPSVLSEHLPSEPFSARTVRTITDQHTLLVELERVRSNGYAFDNEEGDVGVCCLAVPVRRDDEILAALSLAGPAGELSLSSHATYLELLKGAAELLGNDPRFRDAVVLAYRALH
jgi:IclR family acetate operon transcriptional repressor